MARGDSSPAKVDVYLDGTEAGEQLVTFIAVAQARRQQRTSLKKYLLRLKTQT